ncbi:MAG TPA: beta-galactosidase, partial [Planctomycetota bacterium]|nr:beta-galactosidase [Planctomycetota bacterium]
MNVSYDHRAITLDGNRVLLLSGAIHYPRSTPAMWPRMLKLSREAGLNTIETYVFWNLHERARGVFDFSGRLDLMRFCKLVQEQGMNMILRIGPYVCAETNYGGLPPWLRDEPGIRMRTDSEPFIREMGRWVAFSCEYLRPMFAPQGGPIILAQIENEYENVGPRYGEEGQRFLRWISEFSQSLELGVPWIMCSGAAPGILETINGFVAYDEIEKHRQKHPDQPAIWTEHWTGWYNTFGFPRHPRSCEKTAYGDARFFAQGGTGVNYYMWHAGTNFDREPMYLQCPDYGFYAPLDEFGLPTTKYHHLGRLHHILQDYASVLLSSEVPPVQALGSKQAAYAYSSGGRPLVFIVNNDPAAPATVTYEGKQYEL